MSHLAELQGLITRHAGNGGTSPILEGIRLVMATAPRPPISAIYEPCFAVIAQGRKETVLGRRHLEYRGGQYLVVSVDLPIVGQVTGASEAEPYLAVSMTLNSALIASLVLDTKISSTGGPEVAGLSVNRATPDLLDPLVRLLRLLDSPNDAPVLRPLLEREIMWRLLNGEQGSTVRQIGLVDSRLSQVSGAIRWLRANYAESIKISELARYAGMSVSSFHRHFRVVTAMSPLQYQKQVRLQEARNQLFAHAEDAATVGFAVGYQSPSQFSREYSRLFGAPPMRDVSRLRSMSQLEADTF